MRFRLWPRRSQAYSEWAGSFKDASVCRLVKVRNVKSDLAEGQKR